MDIVICEVVLRDGLQLTEKILSTQEKRSLIDRLYAAGVPELDASNFAPPSILPQFADAELVVAYARSIVRPNRQWVVGALAPNPRGAIRAIGAGAQRLYMPVSASHSHNLANLRKTPD